MGRCGHMTTTDSGLLAGRTSQMLRMAAAMNDVAAAMPSLASGRIGSGVDRKVAARAARVGRPARPAASSTSAGWR